MSADFEAEVRNSIRALTAAVQRLEKAHSAAGEAGKRAGDKTVDASKRAQRELERERKAAERARKEAEKKADAPRRAFAQAGLALGRFGGPVGTLATHVSGATGLGPVLGRLAIAAGTLGLATKLAVDNIERMLQKTRLMAETANQFKDAIIAGVKARQGTALGGVTSTEARFRASVAGGATSANSGLDAAKLAKSGHVSGQDAMMAVGEINSRFGLRPEQRANALARVEALTAAGVPLATALEETISAGVESHAPKTDAQKAAFLRRTGRAFARATGLQHANSSQAVAALQRQTDTLAIDPRMEVFDKVRAVQAETQGAVASDIYHGSAETAARGELAAAKNPEAQQTLDLYNQKAREIEVLSRLADQTSLLYEYFKEITGPGSSLTIQLENLTASLEAVSGGARGRE
jgi:hypothetical protein